MLIGSDWSNGLTALNVDNDAAGFVTPVDALLIINELNGLRISDPNTGRLPQVVEGHQPPPFLDVNCDSFVTPNDALFIINYLNGSTLPAGLEFLTPTGQSANYSRVGCGAVLKEGTQFITEIVTPLQIPDGAGAISIELGGVELDESSIGNIHDAFEIALLDQEGKSLVQSFDSGRDAFFNQSEHVGLKTSTQTQLSGRRVILSLDDVLAGTQANLVFRLLNNDGDSNSAALIKWVEFLGQSIGGEGQEPNQLLGSNVDAIRNPANEYHPLDWSETRNITNTTTAQDPPLGTIAGNAPTESKLINSMESPLPGLNGEGSNSNIIDSRGTEFWIGFPDNLFESGNVPQKALHISGEVATTGYVEVPGLIDPNTLQPFRVEFVVNPGEVTAVELPSDDLNDSTADDQTDFDVEAELVAKVQRLGVHVVAQDPVTVYGINRAVNTTDAFLALPIDSLGTEYIDLGYGNTHRLTTNPIGSQFLIVGTVDDTHVQIDPGAYTFSTASSQAKVVAPDGVSAFFMGSNTGADIGPFIGLSGGDWTVEVKAPFDGYSGDYDFELLELASAAESKQVGDIVEVNFPTGKEAKVVSFDIVAGQQIYYDTLNQGSPSVKVWLVSPSGGIVTLNAANDTSTFTNNQFQFRETGTYFVLMSADAEAALDFKFKLIDLDTSPIWNIGQRLAAVDVPVGTTTAYRIEGQVGQQVLLNSLTGNRGGNLSIYGPGGAALLSNHIPDSDVLFTFPQTATYYAWFTQLTTLSPYSYDVELADLTSFAALPTSTTTVAFSGGDHAAYQFAGVAGQTMVINIQAGQGRNDFRVYDPAGNRLTLGGGSGNVRTARLLVDGTYSMTVGGLVFADAGQVTFDLDITDDAPVIKSGLNTEQTLTIAAGETASYQFSAPAGTPLLIDALDTASENLSIDFTAPDGSRLFTGIFSAGELQDIPLISPDFLPQSGTYTITLRGNTSTNAGSYTFRVLDLTDASAINIGDTVSADLTGGREAFVYSFSATAGQQLAFDGLAGTGARLRVFDRYLQRVFPTGAFDTSPTANGLARVIRDGVHYVVLIGEGNVPVNVSFRLLDLAAAPEIAIGQRVSGVVSPGQGRQDYRIDLAAGQRVRLENLLGTNPSGQIRVENVGGRVIYTGSISGDSGPRSYFPVVESGEYIVSILGSQTANVPFDFRIDDIDTAQVLPFDTDLSVVLSPGRETLALQFEANAGDRVDFDNVATAQNLNWSVFGPDSESIGGSNDARDFSVTAIRSGTYYLLLNGRNADDTTVQFRATLNRANNVPLSNVNQKIELDVGIGETLNYGFTAPVGSLLFVNVLKSDFAIRPHNVTLQTGETYLLQDQLGGLFDFNPDLTGSIITSNHPIAVYGSNRCTFMPTQFSACDHLVEQLPATNTWGREFVTVPLATGTTVGDRFRFLAQSDGTEVKIDGIVVATLNRGQFHEQVLTQAAYIQSNGPILVAQYAHSQQFYQSQTGGDPNFLGDPFMVIIPPYEQFLSSYTVSTPAEESIPENERFDRNFINLVAPAEAVGQIELDGVALDAALFTFIGDSGFFGAQVPIDLGSYSLAGPLPFGVFVYGFGSFDSYGYTGGQALSPVADVGSVLLTPEAAHPQVNNSILFNARVADSLGSPIEGIRVDFDVSGVNPQRGFGFSDAQGNVQFSYIGNNMGRDIVTASVGQLFDDSIIDWSIGAAPPQITVVSPTSDSRVPAGTTLVSSGFATADFPNATIDLITVNGVPLNNVDAAGNFFAQLFVAPGDNEYEFTVIDSNNQSATHTIVIRGIQSDETQVDWTQFADVTGSFAASYARTSYNASDKSLFAETAVDNTGQFPADAPLIVAIANISDPLVQVRGADGVTPEGFPYYDFTGLVTGGTLDPQGRTGFLSAAFYNPNQIQFTYELLFYGKLNQPPQFTSLPPTSADLQREYTYQVEALDPNGDAVSFQLLIGPASMTIDAATGLLRWTPGAEDSGVYAVEVQVSDERLGHATQSFNITARPAPANRAPVFTTLPIVTAEVGMGYSYLPSVVDADDEPLTFSILTGPLGLTIDANTGQTSWLPTPQQLGVQSIVIQAVDGHGGVAQQSFSVLVTSAAGNLPPVIVNPPPNAVRLGTFSHQVLALNADGDLLSYQLLDGPVGMTIDATGLMSWNATAADLGAHQVIVQVLDTRGGVDVQSFMLAVFDNHDPSITSQPIVVGQVGSIYTYQVTASDSIDDILSFKLLDAAPGMDIDSASGLITWNVTSTAYEQERVTVAVIDGRGGQATQTFTIDIAGGQSLANNVIPFFISTPPSVASVGTKLLYEAVARDPNGDTLSYDLPLAPDGMVIDPLTGQVGWQPRADQSGMQQVVIRVKDGTSSGIWLQSFQITVDAGNTAPVITSSPIATASVGNPWEYRVDAQDADGDNLMFELLSPANGMVLTALDNADASAVLSFTPSAVGSVQVGVAVKDARGGVVEQRFTLTVVDTAANVAPVVHSVPRSSIAAGQLWFYLLEADDPNGDPLSISLTQAPTGMTFDAALRGLSWEPTTAQLGSHSVTLSLTDGRGGSTQQTFTVEVISVNDNSAPQIVTPPAAFRATLGSPFEYDLRAVDPNGDPVEWTIVAAPQGASIDRRLGTLRWTPTLDHVGSLQRFVISARDPAGLETSQSFSLVVSGTNLAPMIVSRPPSEAVVDERYVYGVHAIDAENDALVYTLTDAPTGMTIDSERGIVRWTPTLNQLGSHRVTIEVSDSHGNSSLQSFDLLVTQVVRNREPIITSRAIFKARVDAEYRYQVMAMDPEAESITFSLVESPAGMQIDATSGLINWTPSAAQVGAHLVRIAAADTSGNVAVQRFAVQARANQAPVIDSVAPTSVSLGGIYRYDVQVTDPEGDELLYQLLVAPAGMEIDTLGRIRWATAPGVEESNPVTIQVTDSFGATVTQTYTLEVTPDTTAPIVTLQLSANPLALGQDSVVVVRARDDVGVVQLELTLDGVPQVLDANNSLTLRGNIAGLYNLQATARDASGNVGTSNVQLRVFDPADTQGPTITITAPSANSIITTLTDIVGSVTDDNLAFYRVDYGRADLVDINNPIEADADYHQLVRRTTQAVDEVLATFDPTMLHNDDYVIRILAEDLSGNVSAKTLAIGMDGQLKLGQFELDFTDLTIPVAGIPITVTRSYDTRDAGESGDFGYGWTLSVSDPNIRETLPVNDLEALGLPHAATPFRDGTRVYLTNPAGRRIAFTFRPQRQFSLFGGGSWSAYFEPDPGVYDKLDVGELQLRQVNGAFYHGFDGAPFNPNAYRLTTKDGTVYEYGQFGGLDNIHDRNGNRIDVRPNGVFSSLGPSIEFIRNPQGRINQIIDPAGNPLAYTYDLDGNLTSFSDQVGNTTSYTYLDAPAHFLDTIVDPRGINIFDAEFDLSGRLISLVDPMSNSTSQAFSTEELLFTMTDARGSTTAFRYDERGNITEETDALGNRTRYEYSDPRNPDLETRVIAADAATTVFAYDERGNLTFVEDAMGGTYRTEYDASNNLIQGTDPLGRAESFRFDPSGKLQLHVGVNGASIKLSYDSLGRLIARDDSSGMVTAFSHSDSCPCGRPNAIIESDGSRVTFQYNSLTNLTSVTDELGKTATIDYDAAGRRVRVIEPGGKETLYSYEGTLLTGYLQRQQNAELGEMDSMDLESIRYEYDAFGRVVRSLASDGGVSEYEYDANGNMISVRDPANNVTQFAYDSLNRVIERRDPFGNSMTYQYDSIGRLASIVDREQQRRVFSYDPLGRMVGETWLDDKGLEVYSADWTYDPVGRLLIARDQFSSIAFSYNTFDQLITTDTAGSALQKRLVLNYEYDELGDLTSVTDDQGFSVESSYDSRRRPVEMVWRGPGMDGVRVEYDYSSRGEVSEIRRFADTQGSILVSRTIAQYGDAYRATNLQHLDEAGVLLEEFSYDYDPLGRLVDKFQRSSGNSSQYTYDSAGQLVNVSHTVIPDESYSYDENGNRLASHLHGSDYVTGPNNQLLADGTFTYVYDKNGRLIQRREVATNASVEYTHDHKGRLVRVKETSASGQVLNESNYVYDILDRRIKVDDNGLVTIVNYAGDHAWADYDQLGAITVRYLFASGLDDLMASFTEARGVVWYLKDSLGSVLGTLDSDGSLLGALAVYDSFGTERMGQELTSMPRFQFAGREFDRNWGTLYFRARQFDPNNGRFTSEDPTGFLGQDMNLFRYAFNSPVNYLDPLGTSVTAEESAIGSLSAILGSLLPGLACDLIGHTLGDAIKLKNNENLNRVVSGGLGWFYGQAAGRLLNVTAYAEAVSRYAEFMPGLARQKAIQGAVRAGTATVSASLIGGTIGCLAGIFVPITIEAIATAKFDFTYYPPLPPVLPPLPNAPFQDPAARGWNPYTGLQPPDPFVGQPRPSSRSPF
ncbi:MAG: hypothetical protein KDB03_06055 [Planctomycetales bacterium]|nr:hypothetical protein [Planctomycetales bacterium]